MNDTQRQKIMNLTCKLAGQSIRTTFKLTQSGNNLMLWADDSVTGGFNMLAAVIGVRGGVRIVTKHGFTI
jgi:hypothetical protein